MVFVVRLRDPLGMHRLVFASAATASWADLQQQVEDVTHVRIADQLLSREPLHKAAYIESKPGVTLQNLKIQNGDVLYLGGHTPATLAAAGASASASSAAAPSSAASSSSAAPRSASSASSSSSSSSAPTPHQLTSRCNHGPRGACPHCLGVEPGAEKSAGGVTGHCNHGPNATCIHCSKAIKEQSKILPVWLCTHPETVFCPKCIPAESEEDKMRPLACDCDRSKGQECSRCLIQPPKIKTDKIPFARFLDDKKGMCKFKHGANVTCAMCVPPTLPSFTGKKSCDKGHQPWPAGVCLSCAPANATIREQPYRHCDSVSIDPSLIRGFYTSWMKSGSVFQRAAILFGRYAPEPESTNNPGAVRASVYALYEPPQENAKDFVRFLKDPAEKQIHALAARLGLEVVGWIVTTQERKGDKYGGNVVMSGLEVQQAARFQNRYKNEFGYSRFVTIVMEHAAQVEPRAYQVSDLAVCLERDGVFAKAADSNMLSTRVPGAGEMVPTVVYKDRPLLPGREFLPDEMIVKVILSGPLAGAAAESSPLKHADFPPLASNPSEAVLKGYLAKYSAEPTASKLADFNLLVYLAAKGVLNEQTLGGLCDAIRDRKPISKDTQAAIDSAWIQKGLV